MTARGVFSGRIADMRIFELIVRCRRSRDTEAWQELRDLVEDDVEGLCRGSDTRWLVSVCDTYADYGTPVERAGAMLVSLLVNWEKMARTLRLLTGEPKPGEMDEEQRRASLWDGVTGVDLAMKTYDMPRNLFERLASALEPVPHLQRILREVTGRLAGADGSIPALLNEASTHRDLPADIIGSVDPGGETGHHTA